MLWVGRFQASLQEDITCYQLNLLMTMRNIFYVVVILCLLHTHIFCLREKNSDVFNEVLLLFTNKKCVIQALKQHYNSGFVCFTRITFTFRQHVMFHIRPNEVEELAAARRHFVAVFVDIKMSGEFPAVFVTTKPDILRQNMIFL